MSFFILDFSKYRLDGFKSHPLNMVSVCITSTCSPLCVLCSFLRPGGGGRKKKSFQINKLVIYSPLFLVEKFS